MTKERKIQLIDRWIKASIRMLENMEVITDAIKAQPESPLFNEPRLLLDAYTECLADALEIKNNDALDWLDYFAYECDYGRKPMEMGFADGEKLTLVGASDLLAAIDTDATGNRKWK